MNLKCLFSITTIVVLLLTSCHQVSKKELQEKNIRNSVKDYVEANFDYPQSCEVTKIEIDTVMSNHIAARQIQSWTKKSNDFDITRSMFEAVADDFTRLRIESYVDLPLFDTTKADVAYVCGEVKIRYDTDNQGNKRVCSLVVFLQNENVISVLSESDKDEFKRTMDKWLPKEIQKIMTVEKKILENFSFLCDI